MCGGDPRAENSAECSRHEKAIDVSRLDEYVPIPFRDSEGCRLISGKFVCTFTHACSRREGRKGEKESKRGRQRNREVARGGESRVQEQLAYRCQRDKTNHRNNRRPPQPTSRHGHVASGARTHERESDIASHRVDSKEREREREREKRTEVQYLYSSIAVPSSSLTVLPLPLCVSSLAIIDRGSSTLKKRYLRVRGSKSSADWTQSWMINWMIRGIKVSARREASSALPPAKMNKYISIGAASESIEEAVEERTRRGDENNKV